MVGGRGWDGDGVGISGLQGGKTSGDGCTAVGALSTVEDCALKIGCDSNLTSCGFYQNKINSVTNKIHSKQ